LIDPQKNHTIFIIKAQLKAKAQGSRLKQVFFNTQHVRDESKTVLGAIQ